MTVTDISFSRTRRRTRSQPGSLRRVEADIRAIRQKLADPHGWQDELTAELDRLTALRDQLLAAPATAGLAA